MPDNLQFDHAEPSPGASPSSGTISCAVCKSLLPETYHVVNGHIVCDKCRREAEAEWNRGGAAGRFGKAVVLGILATIGCSILWYAVIKLTGYELGILAIVVGFVVGGAVRKGSNGRGGWRYQALAIFLTYTAIVSSYVPLVVEEAVRQRSSEITKAATSPDKTLPATDSTVSADSTAAALDKIGPVGIAVAIVLFLGFIYAMPFLAGIQNLLGILIIGVALYEAWKLNRRMDLSVSGPHQVSTSSAPA